jgi:hypothetical protein
VTGRGRHKWGEAERLERVTLRRCQRCGLVRATRHEPNVRPWVEFVRDCVPIKCDRTPPCEGPAGAQLHHENAATACQAGTGRAVRVILGTFRARRLAAAGEIVLDYRRSDISHAGRVLHLAPLFFRVVADIVVAGADGTDGEELAAALYGDREDGGPLNANTIPKTAVHTVGRPLATIGLRINRQTSFCRVHGSNRNYTKRYTIETIAAAELAA